MKIRTEAICTYFCGVFLFVLRDTDDKSPFLCSSEVRTFFVFMHLENLMTVWKWYDFAKTVGSPKSIYFLGRGGATKWKSFSCLHGNDWYGVCDDESEATLRWDSGAGTISGETARNLQKIIDKRTNVLYNIKLVNNVFALQLNTNWNTYFLLIGVIPTHIIWPNKYSPMLGQ